VLSTVEVGEEEFVAFTSDQFLRTRPFLFHLTGRDNVREIRKTHVLYSAAVLMQESGDTSFLRKRRAESWRVQLGAATISIRDQLPLHAGNISLEGGWLFEDVVECLNERVFFWPGNGYGPISYFYCIGSNLVARYFAAMPWGF
jgi:hypothetical protein